MNIANHISPYTMGSMSWSDDMETTQRHQCPAILPKSADETEVLGWLFHPSSIRPATIDEDTISLSWPFAAHTARQSRFMYPSSYAKRQLYDCSVCTERLPLRHFLNRFRHILPHPCCDHLSLQWAIHGSLHEEKGADSSGPVCRGCLSQYLAEQFRTRGAERVQCIKAGCMPPHADQAWKHYAISFLPEGMRSFFNEELTKVIYKRDKWVCPAECGCDEGWTAIPNMVYGWPHVECPSCAGQFCATCRVPWHAGLSCQHFQRSRRWQVQSVPIGMTELSRPLQHTRQPSSIFSTGRKGDPESDYRAIREIEARGARLCPRCQTPIIKDGGCEHMWCIKCELHFTWREAEKVHAIKQDNAVVKKARAPFRFIGAWVWTQRAKWGLWKNSKRNGEASCRFYDAERYYQDYYGDEMLWDEI